MQIRVDEVDDNQFSHKLVFPDLGRLLRARGLPQITAWQTESRDQLPAMRVRLNNPPPNGAVREIGDDLIQFELRPYRRRHPSLNGLLVFNGLDHALSPLGVRSAEARSEGRGSELVTRVTTRTEQSGRRAASGRLGAANVGVITASDVETAPHPERRQTILWRVIRDTETARALKRRHKNECQICGLALPLRNGLTYSEAHHIRPLGEPHKGPDSSGNILILCPNHHAQCDFGAIKLDLALLRLMPDHNIDKQHIDYHNRMIAK
jgi:hypothetical protein